MANPVLLSPPRGDLRLTLASVEAMLHLGRSLGRLLARPPQNAGHGGEEPPCRALLLHGPLGAGKTTLVRGLVDALPGKEQAEVSSPSFTLCNAYPTTPPVLHCDLYRCADLADDGTVRLLPDEVDEALDGERGLVVVEWAERLPAGAKPAGRLDIFFEVCQNVRLARLVSHGAAARRVLEVLAREEGGPCPERAGRS